jgi:hypothetical protein
MVGLILGFAALDKASNQVNAQAQRDDLKHILQKAITGLWPQSPRQKNHNQPKNDTQHEVNRVGFLGHWCIFAHGLAPVLAGWIKRLTLTSPSPLGGLVFSSIPVRKPSFAAHSDEVNANLSLTAPKT